jgi:curved DNA-binding protein CbpA
MADITYGPDHDSYVILGVCSNSFDATELKKSYKRLLLKLHPDKQPVPTRAQAHERFTRMQNAYEILKEPAKRRKYNGERTKHFRKEYRSQDAFTRQLYPTVDDWMHFKELCSAQDEREREQILDEHGKQKANDAARDQEERKRQEEEAQKRRWEEHQHPPPQDQQKRPPQEALEEDLVRLKVERAQMERTFDMWKARQTEERLLEVQGREERQNDLQQHQEGARADFHKRQVREREAQRKKHERESKDHLKRQERERCLQREEQEKERQVQRAQRKRVREEYNSWCTATDNDIGSMQGGCLPPPKKKSQRPDFNRPMYGCTKNGNPCVRCKQVGGFCSQHTGQA